MADPMLETAHWPKITIRFRPDQYTINAIRRAIETLTDDLAFHEEELKSVKSAYSRSGDYCTNCRRLTISPPICGSCHAAADAVWNALSPAHKQALLDLAATVMDDPGEAGG